MKNKVIKKIIIIGVVAITALCSLMSCGKHSYPENYASKMGLSKEEISKLSGRKIRFDSVTINSNLENIGKYSPSSATFEFDDNDKVDEIFVRIEDVGDNMKAVANDLENLYGTFNEEVSYEAYIANYDGKRISISHAGDTDRVIVHISYEE